MASLYKSPDEIDLYLAGMAEKVDSSSGVLGPTFLCIISDQFARLKEADRHFYELGGQPNSFSLGSSSCQLVYLRLFYIFLSSIYRATR